MGTVTVNANGSLARMQSTTQTGDLFLPTNCLPAGVTCTTLSFFIPTVVPGATGTCAAGTNGCDCAVTVNTVENSSGTWSTQNGVITTISGIDTRQYWYCVQGGALQYRGLPNNPTDNEITYVLTGP